MASANELPGLPGVWRPKALSGWRCGSVRPGVSSRRLVSKTGPSQVPVYCSAAMRPSARRTFVTEPSGSRASRSRSATAASDGDGRGGGVEGVGIDGDVGALDELDAHPVRVEDVERALADDVAGRQVFWRGDRLQAASDEVGVGSVGVVDGEREVLFAQVTLGIGGGE